MTPLAQLQPQWPAISELLDEALQLPAAARAHWLASLSGARAEHRGALTALLATQAGVETDDFLAELPKLSGLSTDEPAHPAAPSAAGRLEAGVLVGPYRLIEQIGRGGMATVWLAERADGLVSRRVALKLPHSVWGDSFADRLARERDILATLSHEHIARLYDVGIDNHGRPYLAMEFVEGEAIDAYCRSHQLPLRERIALLLQVMSAVAHAHARLVVHRDLKPSNILVTKEGQVRLLDFGIGRSRTGSARRSTRLAAVAANGLSDGAAPRRARRRSGRIASTARGRCRYRARHCDDVRHRRLNHRRGAGSAAPLLGGHGKGRGRFTGSRCQPAKERRDEHASQAPMAPSRRGNAAPCGG
ncbi:MAG: serine/threonine protein kinase, partial [Pseudomonadota bacterium]|nr:serine/threonine protein kinase [Pseudomonadota bacterium]